MPSSADDLLLSIIVHYHLHILDLLVVRKGSIVYHVVHSVLSVSLYNPGLDCIGDKMQSWRTPDLSELLFV